MLTFKLKIGLPEFQILPAAVGAAYQGSSLGLRLLVFFVSVFLCVCVCACVFFWFVVASCCRSDYIYMRVYLCVSLPRTNRIYYLYVCCTRRVLVQTCAILRLKTVCRM